MLIVGSFSDSIIIYQNNKVYFQGIAPWEGDLLTVPKDYIGKFYACPYPDSVYSVSHYIRKNRKIPVISDTTLTYVYEYPPIYDVPKNYPIVVNRSIDRYIIILPGYKTYHSEYYIPVRCFYVDEGKMTFNEIDEIK